MYRVKSLGINSKESDWNVKDGFLQESINLQWRDGSLKPIPERLLYQVNPSGYTNIIFHKVGDENVINVLGFNTNVSSDSLFLAFDLAEYLAGGTTAMSALEWFGSIVDGEFQSKTVTQLPIFFSPNMSFTILNGMVYFMGDGSAPYERYYTRLQFNESTNSYDVKDMYAWKDLIPTYPVQEIINLKSPNDAYNVLTQCGLINIRFALVLNSGEVVLHSPVYCYVMYGLNRQATILLKDDIIENIHTIINMNFSFADEALLAEEVSAINIYASIPYYEGSFLQDTEEADYSGAIFLEKYGSVNVIGSEKIKGEFERKAEEPFYLVKTIEKPTTDKLLLTVGSFASDISDEIVTTRIDVSTIAAGEIMPVDNFTYHKVYGRITSYNGRIIIERPRTVLSGGHIRALATEDVETEIGYRIDTEDGKLEGLAYKIDKGILYPPSPAGTIQARGMLSYPDARANYVGGNNALGNGLRLYKCRKNSSHNMACHFNASIVGTPVYGLSEDSVDNTLVKTLCTYHTMVVYDDFDEETAGGHDEVTVSYSSENRVQFSEVGEFSVWPAVNSYRVGEGKIVRVGFNSVNPGNADIVAPLIIGTSDGIYTMNLDPSGNNLIASITKTANIPYISSEVLAIDKALLFISDQGLMVINNGDIANLTSDFFPDQGDGNFPANESVYNGYNILTTDFFGENGNPYLLDDIIEYMKGAILAYDGRRETIWCSNANYNFSLVYSLKSSLWSMSTLVFKEKVEAYSIFNIDNQSVYTRFMVVDKTSTKLLVLSGEDLSQEVDFHLLTRAIKFSPGNPAENADKYKQINRLTARCVLKRNTSSGYFALGVWGKQDVNKYKKAISIVAKKDNRSEVFPNDVRQDIPVNNRKGKYKAITALLCGKALPDSDITAFDFDAGIVDDKRMR